MLILHIIHTSISLAIVYGSYLLSTDYLTLKYSEYGFWAYTILFICNVISSILAPFIVYYITGIKSAIIIGSICYIVWLFLFNMNNIVCLLVGSIILGCGAGLFRSQQNVWVTTLEFKSSEQKNQYVGIYNTIFSLNSIIAPLFAIVAFSVNLQLETLIWILFTLSLMSLVSMFFIKSIPLDQTHNVNRKKYFMRYFKVSFLLLLPIIFAQALSLTITYEVIPLYIVKNENVAIFFLIYGVSYVISSYLQSYAIRKVDPLIILLMTIPCYVGITIYTFVCYYYRVTSTYIFVSILLAFADSILYFVLVHTIHENFKSKTYYSIYRVYVCVFSVIGTNIALYIDYYTLIYIMVICVLISILFYIIFRYRIDSKIDKGVKDLQIV